MWSLLTTPRPVSSLHTGLKRLPGLVPGVGVRGGAGGGGGRPLTLYGAVPAPSAVQWQQAAEMGEGGQGVFARGFSGSLARHISSSIVFVCKILPPTQLPEVSSVAWLLYSDHNIMHLEIWLSLPVFSVLRPLGRRLLNLCVWWGAGGGAVSDLPERRVHIG